MKMEVYVRPKKPRHEDRRRARLERSLVAVDHGLELNRRERMNRGNGTISELADASHQVSSAFAATGYGQ